MTQNLASKNFYKILLTIIILLLVIGAFHYFHLNNYLGIEGFNNYSNQILQFRGESPIIFLITYFIIYILLITCCIPGTVALDIIAGFLFGLLWGSILVIVSFMVGIILNYIVVHFLFHEFFLKRLSKFEFEIKSTNQKILFINLTGLRLVPIIPFWVVNIMASVMKVRLNILFLSSLIGITPVAIVYAWVGVGMRDLALSHHQLTAKMLFNPKIWLPLLTISILMILPSIYNKLKHTKK